MVINYFIRLHLSAQLLKVTSIQIISYSLEDTPAVVVPGGVVSDVMTPLIKTSPLVIER